MEAALVAKIISGSLVLLVSLIVGLLPLILSRKYPLLSPKDPGFNKKSGRNKFFSFLLNFGGGVLFANCFCHWLPEVREAVEKADIDSFVPLAEAVTCSGFFIVSFLEELVHHFIHPHDNASAARGKVSSKIQKRPLTQQQEFELYDKAQRNIEVHQDVNISIEPEVSRNQEQEVKAGRMKSLLRTFFVVTSLSFHSAIAGLTLGLENDSAGVWINFGAIAMHKFVIVFSVGVELVTSGASRVQYYLSIIIFSSAPAIGVAIGTTLSQMKGDGKDQIENDLILQLLQAVAAGMVLYVIFFEIFPKAKDIGGTGFQHVLAMIIGFAFFLPSLLFHKHEEDGH